MKIYKRHAGKWVNSFFNPAAEFKYIEASNFIFTQPKWEATVFGCAKEHLEREEYVTSYDVVGDHPISEGQAVENRILFVSDYIITDTEVMSEWGRTLGAKAMK